jgi:hypothetical protein
MIRKYFQFAAVGVALILSVQAFAQSGSGLEARRGLAKAAIDQIKLAAENFEKACGVKIFQGRLPGEVNCGKGNEMIGNAWTRTLNNTGYPETPQQRKLAAQNLGLTSSAALVFVLGPADDEKLGYLIKELGQIQANGN